MLLKAYPFTILLSDVCLSLHLLSHTWLVHILQTISVLPILFFYLCNFITHLFINQLLLSFFSHPNYIISQSLINPFLRKTPFLPLIGLKLIVMLFMPLFNKHTIPSSTRCLLIISFIALFSSAIAFFSYHITNFSTFILMKWKALHIFFHF